VKIFISWSKEPSKTVAEALRDWLPDVLQSLEPWMSSADIGAGARWSGDIAKALAESKIGIICVTSQNQAEPWLNFEAGTLAKTIDGTCVCPYLVGMRTSDLKSGPLTQFQAKTADEEGTWELVATINRANGNGQIPEDRLRRLFDRAWPDLKRRLATLPSLKQPQHRSQEEMLAEVLDTVRTIVRELNDSQRLNELRWDDLVDELSGARSRRANHPEQVALFEPEPTRFRLTIDARSFLDGDSSTVMSFDGSETVSGFLDAVYFLLQKKGAKIDAFTYPTRWVLKCVRTGRLYDDIGVEYCESRGDVRDDARILTLGIRDGDCLVVLRPENIR
jgi:hypothetical protein